MFDKKYIHLFKYTLNTLLPFNMFDIPQEGRPWDYEISGTHIIVYLP